MRDKKGKQTGRVAVTLRIIWRRALFAICRDALVIYQCRPRISIVPRGHWRSVNLRTIVSRG
jgi:hypothetical protein